MTRTPQETETVERSSVPTRGTTYTIMNSGPRRLRIIGGQWRGTRLTFPDLAAIRPSPDRVRETLFNWLQPSIRGVRCLDLFAGSGVLGLEALSRGAEEAVFVDREPEVGRYLRATLERLHAVRAEVHVMEAERYLASAITPFELVFLDPPFGRGLTDVFLHKLIDRGLLAPNALVYVEAESKLGSPATPSGWEVLKSKQAGEVGYHLLGPYMNPESAP